MEIDRAAAAVAGKEASFTQRFTPKGFKNAQVESGSVIFGRMPMMRWSYTTPEEKLFVFDGERLDDRGRVHRRRSDSRDRELQPRAQRLFPLSARSDQE